MIIFNLKSMKYRNALIFFNTYCVILPFNSYYFLAIKSKLQMKTYKKGIKYTLLENCNYLE